MRFMFDTKFYIFWLTLTYISLTVSMFVWLIVFAIYEKLVTTLYVK